MGGAARRPAGDLGIARDRVDAFLQHPAHGRSRGQWTWWRRWPWPRCCRLALVVGMVIALQATSGGRLGLDAAGARGASQGRRGRRIQRALVAAEVALALVLLCGAGVLVEGARTQARVDAGFDTDGLLHARVTLPRDKYSTPALQRQVLERMVDALSAIPGVRHAGVVDVPPGVGGSNARAVLLDTDPAPRTTATCARSNIRIADALVLCGARADRPRRTTVDAGRPRIVASGGRQRGVRRHASRRQAGRRPPDSRRPSRRDRRDCSAAHDRWRLCGHQGADAVSSRRHRRCTCRSMHAMRRAWPSSSEPTGRLVR